MQASQCTKLCWGIVQSRHLFFRLAQKRLERAVERGHQDLLFRFEVKIDGSISDVGAIGDVRNAAIVESLFPDYGNGCIQNALVLVAAAAVDFDFGGSSPVFGQLCRF